MDKWQYFTLCFACVLGYLQIRQELKQIKDLVKKQEEQNEYLHKETVDIVDRIVEHHLREKKK